MIMAAATATRIVVVVVMMLVTMVLMVVIVIVPAEKRRDLHKTYWFVRPVIDLGGSRFNNNRSSHGFPSASSGK
jgi:hypothetical protein